MVSLYQTALAFLRLSLSSYKGDREESRKLVLASLPVLSHWGCKGAEIGADHKAAKGKSEVERKPFPLPQKDFNKDDKGRHQKAGSCNLYTGAHLILEARFLL